MGQYQRLLLIADRTLHQSPALLRAVALAKACGAVLHVRAFVEPAPVVHLWEEKTDDAGYQRYMRRYRRWVADEVQRLSGQGLEVTVEVVFSTHPLLDILKTVEDLKPDLLIKDVTLEPVLKRVFITPLDCHLLRDCPIPVHLVNQVQTHLVRLDAAQVRTKTFYDALETQQKTIFDLFWTVMHHRVAGQDGGQMPMHMSGPNMGGEQDETSNP